MASIVIQIRRDSAWTEITMPAMPISSPAAIRPSTGRGGTNFPPQRPRAIKARPKIKRKTFIIEPSASPVANVGRGESGQDHANDKPGSQHDCE